jgi:hypothetical protein
MKTLEMVVLPIEVQELSKLVTVEKREEVVNTLNQIFAGTADWKAQVDAIEVKDINDVMSIKLADAARLNAKNARLAAEKIFDAKREEVQTQMQSFQTEDKLWLKGKQTMQILFKDIEDSAKYKAEFAKRYEAEQKELKTLQRMNKVQSLNPDLHRLEFENMSDESFDVFLKGIESAIEEKKETDRIAENQRLEAIRLENERIEAQRVENEILKKEAAEKEAQLQKERQESAKAMQEAIAEQQRLAKIEQDKQASILAKQKEETDRIFYELKAENDRQAKEQREREAIEIAAKKEADKLAKAPIKKQLQSWVNSFSIGNIPEHNKAILIQQKFESFKQWAFNEIETI